MLWVTACIHFFSLTSSPPPASFQASQGVYEDNSGPEMRLLLQKMSDDEGWPLTVVVAQTGIIPDDKGMFCPEPEPELCPELVDVTDVAYAICLQRPLLNRCQPGVTRESQLWT